VQPGTTLFGIQDWQPKTQTRTSYDRAGRVTATAFVVSGAEQWRSTVSYRGNRVNVVMPAGTAATTTVTDARGRTIEQRRYHNPVDVGSDVRTSYDLSAYHFDRKGRQDSTTDNAGNSWTQSFDLLGRVVTSHRPDQGDTTTTYSNAGDELTSSDAGGLISYEYDTLGRTTKKYSGAIAPTNLIASWAYDPPGFKGQLASSSRWLNNATEEYKTKVRSYSPLYQSTGEDITIPLTTTTTGLANIYTFSRTFRSDGSPATLTYPSGGGLSAETVTYTYDPVTGLPEQLQTNNGLGQYVSNTDYSAFGETTFLQYQLLAGSWLQQSFTYDDATRRMTRATALRQTTPQAVADVQYGYDASGNIKAITTSDSAGAVDAQCFGYDYDARLADAWTPASGDCGQTKSAGTLGGPAPYWQSWTFDAVGARASQVDHTSTGDITTTYHRDLAAQPHAVTSTTGPLTRNYAYDAAGNTTCRPAGATANTCPSGTGSQTLSWDAEGRLSTVVDTTGTSRYIYSTDGSRLITDDPAAVTLSLPGMEIRRTKAGGVVTANRYYVWNGSICAMMTTGGAVTWLVNDHQGTQNVAVAAGNQAVSTRRQNPFGAARGTPSAWANQKGFVGGDNDATGLVHVGARGYDAAIGSFISVDPVFDGNDPRSWISYGYANNTPVTASDPSGLRVWDGDESSGSSGSSGYVTTVSNPMACATYLCYQQMTQNVADIKNKIEQQKQSELQHAMNCATQTCHDQIVAAVNSGQYDTVTVDGHTVTTDGTSVITYTPEAIMQKIAAPPEPAQKSCNWNPFSDNSCASHAFNSAKQWAAEHEWIGAVLSTISIIATIAAFICPVLAPLAIAASVVSGLYSLATGDFIGAVASIPGVGVGVKALRVARSLKAAKTAYEVAKEAGTEVVSKRARHDLGRVLGNWQRKEAVWNGADLEMGVTDIGMNLLGIANTIFGRDEKH